MGAGDVFGQVEIMRPGAYACGRGGARAMKRQGVEHRVAARDGLLQRIVIAHLRRPAPQPGDRLQARRVLVRNQDVVVAAALQQQGDGGADLAGAEDGDGVGRSYHGRLPGEGCGHATMLTSAAVDM
ncbi:Uncharacterised protein [Bordetella pertussis]|nr:Uncharacterised protein [Bordetella pertussis]